MGFDPKIALDASAGPVLPNPLEFFGRLQGIQKQQHENLLMQQQNDARVAQGEAYKRAIGPDGRVDEAKLMELLKGTSGGQFALPEALAAGQAREKEYQALQEKNLALGRQRIGMFSEAIGGLLTKGENVTAQDVNKVVAKLALQVGDPALAKTIFLGMSDMPAGGKALQDWIKQQNTMLLSAAEKIGFQTGELRLTDVGGQVVGTVQDRLAGTVGQPMAPLDKTPTPGERIALVPGATDPKTGAPVARTMEQTVPLTSGQGRIVSTPAPGAQVIGPSIEAKENLTASSSAYNKELTSIAEQMTASQKNLQEIEKMRELLEQIKTGPTAGMRTTAAQWANDLGLSRDVVRAISGGSDPETLAAAEAFMKKTWGQSLASLRAAVPGGTHWTGQEVFSNYENNPNMKMTPQAIRDLFDFETFKYRYLQESQDYKTNWRTYNPDKPLRQMEIDWAKEAEKRGLVKPVTSGRGEGATGLINAPLIRDELIPSWVTIIDLGRIPRGASGEISSPTGEKVKVRRGNEQNGNTFSVVR